VTKSSLAVPVIFDSSKWESSRPALPQTFQGKADQSTAISLKDHREEVNFNRQRPEGFVFAQIRRVTAPSAVVMASTKTAKRMQDNKVRICKRPSYNMFSVNGACRVSAPRTFIFIVGKFLTVATHRVRALSPMAYAIRIYQFNA